MGVDWSEFFPRFYRTLARLDPLIGLWWRLCGMGNIVELTVPGRSSGKPRRLFLGLLTIDGRRYLGHPNGETGWTRNLDAAGGGILQLHVGPPARFVIVPLPEGTERDEVIGVTWHQHVFPGNLIYWLARRHIRAVGRYYRLEPAPYEAAATGPSA